MPLLCIYIAFKNEHACWDVKKGVHGCMQLWAAIGVMRMRQQMLPPPRCSGSH